MLARTIIKGNMEPFLLNIPLIPLKNIKKTFVPRHRFVTLIFVLNWLCKHIHILTLKNTPAFLNLHVDYGIQEWNK